MSKLDSLIRLNRWQLDEKRRALAELETLAERLTDESGRLEAEIAAERAAAGEDETGFGFAAYIRNALKRRARLQQSIRQVEQQVAAAKEEIALAFQELKRFELAQEERERRALLRRRRAETLVLDEIALTGYQRRRAAEVKE